MENYTYRRMPTEYYRKYYHERYLNDPVYREKKKKYEKDRLNAKYIRRTLTCQRCKVSKRLTYMEEIDYQYDKDNFFCTECHPENFPGQQIKCDRGQNVKKDTTLII